MRTKEGLTHHSSELIQVFFGEDRPGGLISSANEEERVLFVSRHHSIGFAAQFEQIGLGLIEGRVNHLQRILFPVEQIPKGIPKERH